VPAIKGVLISAVWLQRNGGDPCSNQCTIPEHRGKPMLTASRKATLAARCLQLVRSSRQGLAMPEKLAFDVRHQHRPHPSSEKAMAITCK